MCIDSANIDKDILHFLRYHAERNISIFIQFLLRHLFHLSEIKKYDLVLDESTNKHQNIKCKH